jgi:N-acetylglucosamine-6-sulfatase
VPVVALAAAESSCEALPTSMRLPGKRARLGLVVLALGSAACGDDKHAGGPRSAGSGSAAAPGSGSASAGRSADARPTGTAPSGAKPNVVFILADDQRLDAARCMPKLRELIGDKGVTFTRNFAATPLCCPGRSTILTGLYAHNHGVITNGDIEEEGEPDDEKVPGAVAFRDKGNDERVFARWLKEAGYATGYFGKYLNGYGKILKTERGYVPPHWDEWHAFKEPEYYDFQLVEKSGKGETKTTCYLTNREGVPRERKAEKTCREKADAVVDGKESYSTDVITDMTIAFIRASVKSGTPFFVHLAVKAPHGPFESPVRYQPDLGKVEFTDEAMARLGSCPLFDWKDRPPSFLEPDVGDKPEWVQDLAGKLEAGRANKVRKKQLVSVLATEDALVKIVAVLKELHVENDTIVVYTGDNGYAWGEHSYLAKNCAYDECAMVPLVVYDPRHPAGGKTVDAFTMNIDLAPTFLELGGAKLGAGVKVDGRSLVPLFGGDASGWKREHVLTECWGLGTKAHPDIHAAVRSKEWKYVEHYDDNERKKIHVRKDGAPEIELYDLTKDPHELDNLARLPEARLTALGQSAGDVQRREQELAKLLHDLEAQ